MRRLHILVTIATLIASGCTTPAQPVQKLSNPALLWGVVNQDLPTRVRLISATGESTGWLPSEELVMVGDLMCLKSDDPPWEQISAVRVTDLTDANIAAILADLPPSIRVVHLGNGEARLETDGEDLTPWMRSKAHDPSDVEVPRYHVMAWDVWRGPLTWAELQRASRPLLGWSVTGASAELREVKPRSSGSSGAGSSAALVAVALPFIIVAAGLSAAGRMSSPLPSDQPRRSNRGHRATDAPLRLVGEALKMKSPSDAAGSQAARPRSPRDVPGSWTPRPCYRSLPPEAKP